MQMLCVDEENIEIIVSLIPNFPVGYKNVTFGEQRES